MKVSLDIEGTLADIHMPVIELLEERKGTSLSEIERWNLKGHDLSLDEFLETAKGVWEERWEEVPPTEPSLKNKISKLDSDHEVDLVTSRKNSVEEMKKWVQSHEVPYSDFISIGEKYELDYDVWIDDSPLLARKIDPVILYDEPWNQRVPDSEIVDRVGTTEKDLSNIEEILETLDK